ncbi:hypothetical protein IB211_01886 [Intestinimonas butyriciproducens]|uniref:Uncharacterized protein n=1 Tax=Intestinimonas butyriciproducens TaxID=1297617 RepID=A0A0S2W4M2_9FIRM|nr:hypothetical protein IB211_01886 [Intestinimonas butyriciproducens]
MEPARHGAMLCSSGWTALASAAPVFRPGFDQPGGCETEMQAP